MPIPYMLKSGHIKCYKTGQMYLLLTKPNIDIDKIDGFTVASFRLTSQTLIRLVKKVSVAIRQIA